MGHYYSEMYSKYDDHTLRQDYEKRKIKEINKLIHENKTISIKEVKVGDVLVVSDLFFKKSKVKFDETEDEPTKDVFSNLYLTWGEIHDPARIRRYIKSPKKTKYTVKRVDKSGRKVCLNDSGIVRLWLDIRYFQKLTVKRKVILEKR